MRKLLVLFALCAAQGSPVEARDISLHAQCYGNRCVYYRPDGRRVGSVTDYGWNRQVLRDNANRRVGTLTRQRGRIVLRRGFP